MILFGYWRSSATYRVRIALALKGLPFEYRPVNLLNGEHRRPEYLARNPQGLVPALVAEKGLVITQSNAIVEYLEERYPERPLLPADPGLRARARAIAAICACEGQPFMNLRVQTYLKDDCGFDAAAIQRWLDRWVGGAMAAIESLVEGERGYCIGDAPGFADAFVVPQVFAAQRFGVDLAAAPKIRRIYETCLARDDFKSAAPPFQPDAPKEPA